MSSYGLTSDATGGRDSPRLRDFEGNGEQQDSASEGRSQSVSRSPGDILSDVYRGIKKAIPSRDESARPSRAPSRLALNPFATNPSPPPPSATIGPGGGRTNPTPPPSRHQQQFQTQPPPSRHGRNLSLQNSLAKPLPEPPPPELSPTSLGPTTPLASALNVQTTTLSSIVDSDYEP